MEAFNSLMDVEYCLATVFSFFLKDVSYFVVHDVLYFSCILSITSFQAFFFLFILFSF